MFASRNHQSTNKTTQCSDSNKYQESPIPPAVEDIACNNDKEILQQKLVLALAQSIVKDEPIEEKNYWQKKSKFKGVKEHEISFINLSQWMVFKCFINSFAF